MRRRPVVTESVFRGFYWRFGVFKRGPRVSLQIHLGRGPILTRTSHLSESPSSSIKRGPAKWWVSFWLPFEDRKYGDHRCPFWLFRWKNRWRFLVYLVVLFAQKGHLCPRTESSFEPESYPKSPPTSLSGQTIRASCSFSILCLGWVSLQTQTTTVYGCCLFMGT